MSSRKVAAELTTYYTEATASKAVNNSNIKKKTQIYKITPLVFASEKASTMTP